MTPGAPSGLFGLKSVANPLHRLAAATPTGGSPDRELVGRLVGNVLGHAGGTLRVGGPAVD